MSGDRGRPNVLAKPIGRRSRRHTPPTVECLLLHYAYGKPREQVEHQGVIRLFWIGEEPPAE